MTTPDRPPSFMDRVREAPKFVKIGVPILLVLIIIGAAASGEEDQASDTTGGEPAQGVAKVEASNGTKPSSDASKEEDASESDGQGEQADPGPSAGERVREALGDEISSDFAVGDSAVLSVEASFPVVNVDLETPSGGFEGASTDDTDALASAAFAKVFGGGGWRGIARIAFRGGLVSAATGEELSDLPTASYRVGPREAKQIDWSDEEALYGIDWSLYRELCHPALKGC